MDRHYVRHDQVESYHSHAEPISSEPERAVISKYHSHIRPELRADIGENLYPEGD